jgi:hypothetical protein
MGEALLMGADGKLLGRSPLPEHALLSHVRGFRHGRVVAIECIAAHARIHWVNWLFDA